LKIDEQTKTKALTKFPILRGRLLKNSYRREKAYKKGFQSLEGGY